MATTIHHLHARCTRCGRIAVAVPTPGIAAPSAGCAVCGSIDYSLAAAAELEAVPDGCTMTEILVPMAWQAEARFAALQAKPVFSRCGIAVGAGWLSLLERLVAGIEAMPGGAAIRASDCKEKFGGLRLYTHVDDHMLATLQPLPAYDGPSADDLISAAEDASEHVCQWCGDVGETVTIHGWVSTLCSRHQAVAKLGSADLSAWWPRLNLPVDLPARPDLNRAWAAVMANADQLQALGSAVIGLCIGEPRPLEPLGVYAGHVSDDVRMAMLAAVQGLLGGWPVKPCPRDACQRLAPLGDPGIRRHAALAAHPLMASGAKVRLGCTEWLPIIERLLEDLVNAGVPEGRIKAIRPGEDGRLTVHPKLTGEAGPLVEEAAAKAADVEKGRAG